MSVARFAFGPRLKAHRERQGITLQEIADSTKIGVSLLTSLEGNDVSQWPKGIYRRAFLRSYSRAIDMPFDAVWTEFVHLFPEDGLTSTTQGISEASQLRLTLATTAPRLHRPQRSDVLAALVDASVVLLIAAIASLLPFLSLWVSLAVTSLIYSAAATTLVGESFARWYLRNPRLRTFVEPDYSPVIEDDLDVDVEVSPPTVSAAMVQTVEPAPLPLPLPQPQPQPRPRMFAVPPPRTATSTETRERRVADR